MLPHADRLRCAERRNREASRRRDRSSSTVGVGRIRHAEPRRGRRWPGDRQDDDRRSNSRVARRAGACRRQQAPSRGARCTHWEGRSPVGAGCARGVRKTRSVRSGRRPPERPRRLDSSPPSRSGPAELDPFQAQPARSTSPRCRRRGRDFDGLFVDDGAPGRGRAIRRNARLSGRPGATCVGRGRSGPG